MPFRVFEEKSFPELLSARAVGGGLLAFHSGFCLTDLQKEKILHMRKLDGNGPGVTAFLIVMT